MSHSQSGSRARVVEILMASSPSAGMEQRSEARALPGQGLEGDRYFSGLGTFSPHPQKPAYELTLIQQEFIDDFRNRTGLSFTSRHARRNLVTEGVDLNSLVGKEFTVGEVLLRGIKLCEPCAYMAKISFPEVLPGLVGKGGLRAQILRGGVIRRGDTVQPVAISKEKEVNI